MESCHNLLCGHSCVTLRASAFERVAAAGNPAVSTHSYCFKLLCACIKQPVQPLNTSRLRADYACMTPTRCSQKADAACIDMHQGNQTSPAPAYTMCTYSTHLSLAVSVHPQACYLQLPHAAGRRRLLTSGQPYIVSNNSMPGCAISASFPPHLRAT